MKKIIVFIVLLLAIAVCFILFKTVGPATRKTADGFLYIRTGTNLKELKQQLLNENMLSSLFWLNQVNRVVQFKTVKPGKYKVENGTSVLNLLRMLKNGSQTPVKLVITKIRTKELLAERIGRYFETDSATAIQFLNNDDSLQPYQLNSDNIIGMVLPLTYELNWTSSMRTIMDKFYHAYSNFWTAERKQKAKEHGLSVHQVITIASIVDEETNKAVDKPLIASVYANRFKKGMRLQADPTVKFALKDFSLKRIMQKHLGYDSPFNTYKYPGLPPGPICTPQLSTIDSVLNMPATQYLFFVASSKFDGTHIFTENYTQHQVYARQYQEALTNEIRKRDSLAAIGLGK